jgi:hypothetical protein
MGLERRKSKTGDNVALVGETTHPSLLPIRAEAKRVAFSHGRDVCPWPNVECLIDAPDFSV